MALLYALHIKSNGWDGTVGEERGSASTPHRLRGYGGGIAGPRRNAKGSIARQWDVLECEFTALFVAEESVFCAITRLEMVLGSLTARTLNNEVLPAFCRPIIVISISVALLSGDSGQHHGSVAARELRGRRLKMIARHAPG
jgi:hypothetical protein